MTNHSAAPAAPHSADALKQQSRAEFEAHIRAKAESEEYATLILQRNGLDEYSTVWVQAEWNGWQAAWNRSPTPASDLCADLNAERINPTPASPGIDIEALRKAAEAATPEVWHMHSDGSALVYGADGDSVCDCYTNIGAMPEPIFDTTRAAFIAAANPAAILALLDRLERAEADAKHYSMGADAEAKSADEWRERALRAEAAAGAVPLVVPDFDGSPCAQCGDAGVHICEKSAREAGPGEAKPVAWCRQWDLEQLDLAREVAPCPENFSVTAFATPRLNVQVPLFATPPAQDAGTGELEREAARWRYIEEHATTQGGGHGFTITCFVPVDHEDIGCGIDIAIANSGRTE